MAKKLRIELIDKDIPCSLYADKYDTKYGDSVPFLQMHDIKNIFSKVTDGESAYEDRFDYAIDRLILHMCARSINKIIVNIDDRDKLYSKNTAREMTLDQIEKELGYKVKIIAQEESQ